MRVLHVCLANFYIDNFSYQENILSKYHKLQGNEVSIIASLASFDNNGKLYHLPNRMNYINEEGIQVVRIPYNKYLGIIAKKLRIYEDFYDLLVSMEPELIFLHGCQFWGTNIILKYMKYNRQVKVVADFHSDFFNSAKTWISKNIFHRIIWKSRIKLLEKHVLKFYCTTPCVMDFVKTLYGIIEDRLEILPLGSDTSIIEYLNNKNVRLKMREELDIENSDIVIIHGAKISDEKKTVELIEAFKDLPSNSHLIIFGNVLEEYKDQFYNAIEGCNRIHYIGWQNTKSIYSYYYASDIACFPGGQSTLWQEAIACGLPLVCMYTEGLEYLDVGGNILFLANNTPTIIFKMLNLLVQNQELVKKMSYIAKTRGREKFSYNRIASKVIEDVMRY